MKTDRVSSDTPRLMTSAHTIEEFPSCELVYRMLKNILYFNEKQLGGEKLTLNTDTDMCKSHSLLFEQFTLQNAYKSTAPFLLTLTNYVAVFI